MLNRAVISFAVLWAFLAVPSLCGAGLLAHACQQHAANDCGHESDCSDDPCAKFVSAATLSLRITGLDVAHPPAAVILPDILSGGCLPSAHLVPASHPPRGAPPAVVADRLPLLI
ncbi:hypothetical protein RAS1_22860 [Phycisphaerae bacterium RAS1]|nr:hypothetical protein RAS1_22860 [Phycisphaerae bacterium RAS1]